MIFLHQQQIVFIHHAVVQVPTPSRHPCIFLGSAIARRKGYLVKLGWSQFVLFTCIPEVRQSDRSLQLLLTIYRADRLAVLDAVKDAKLKTLRIFISHTFANNKDTGSVEMLDIEPQQVGTYDDTQLRAIDQLMVEAHDRGMLQP
jgi:hypothetical protein